MSKQLYEEALADARQLKEVAEDNAKRAVLETVTPRIRDLIENELFREFDESVDELDEDALGAPGSNTVAGHLMTDEEEAPLAPVPELGDSDVTASAITPPDEEGKVTLDLDALAVDPAGASVEPPMFGDEYELSVESIEALTPVINATKSGITKELEVGLYRIGERLEKFKAASRIVKESRDYIDQITHMISRVENMYDYVQESITDPAKKNAYETQLETYFKELNKLQEHKMSKKTLKDLMNEGDVTLKLTGLPDELDLDSVGVDLITGEEGEESGEEGAEASGDEAGESGEEGGEGGDFDLDDIDLSDDEGSEGDDTQMGESRRLSDDTIVEIDEGMLRREIARMKKLREDAVPSTKGSGADAVLDQFGDGKGEGDPWLDGEVTTEGDEEDVDESQMMDEVDGDLTMDEADDDDLDQAQDVRAVGGNVADPSMGPGAETNKQNRMPESYRRRLGFEARLQSRIKARGTAVVKETARARVAKDSRKLVALKKEHAVLRQRFTESMDRSKKLSRMLAEAKSRSGANLNGSPTRPAESTADANLRNKLAETNLFNAKLVYTNKLLQNEALSKRQKAEIIERLDEANSPREAKLVYESLSKTLAGTSRPLNEGTDRKVMGSASRTTRPASTNLNEGYETDRWARLAGINK